MAKKLVIVGALIASLVVAAGCGTTTVRTQGDTDAGQTTAPEPGTTTEPASPEKNAGVGDSITLAGNDDGEDMNVTLLRVVNDDRDYDEFFGPSHGNRYFALYLSLSNVGTAVYNDSPSNGATVIDRDDQGYDATFGGISPDLGSPTIRPGDSRKGWVTFELPRNVKVRTFQFTLDSGFGPEAGEWHVR